MSSENVLITSPLADIQARADAADLTLNLFNSFDDPRTTGQVAQFQLEDSSLGNGGRTNVLLFDQAGQGSPTSVANFLSYANAGAYTDSFIHRAISGFVVQGGGFTASDSFPTVPTSRISTTAPIALDYSAERPNTRGTIAFARTGDPDSATSQWFFNLVDNTNNLGPNSSSDGYAVFGEVLNPETDLIPIDAIAALPNQDFGSPFTDLPINAIPPVAEPYDFSQPDELVRYESITASQQQELTFRVLSNSNPALVVPSIANGQLTLDYQPGQSGDAEITIRATNLQGDFTDDSFSVSIPNASPSSSGDFNADGANDLLLYNPAQQWSGIGFMSGGSIIGSAPLLTGWKPAATGDFDRDGQTDIVVQNTDNGWKGILYMEGSSIRSSQGITGWDDWDILGTGNFNGDSIQDIVVRHQSQPWYGILSMGGTDGSQVVNSQGINM